MVKLMVVGASVLAIAACATTEGSKRTAGLSSDAQEVVAESSPAQPDGDKQSLDELTDKYRTVTLVDDKTGKPKLICKRVKRPGTLFETKVCSTKEEWDLARREGKDKTDAVQRQTDPRCGVAPC